MQQMCDYDDVTESVLDYFKKFAERADAAGIREWILDPGFGFAKTIEQNYRLLADLERFSGPEMPVCKSGKKPRILVGVSRKSMIYKMFSITPDESLAQTQVLHLAAIERGASILRVHDVAEAARTVQIDLGHDNVQEMCPPDSSLTLRMTEGAFRMTERTLGMTCKGMLCRGISRSGIIRICILP